MNGNTAIIGPVAGHEGKPAKTRTGVAKPIENVGEMASNFAGAAFSGAVDAPVAGGEGLAEGPRYSGIDPALRLLVDVRVKLSDSVKNQILRLADDAV